MPALGKTERLDFMHEGKTSELIFIPEIQKGKRGGVTDRRPARGARRTWQNRTAGPCSQTMGGMRRWVFAGALVAISLVITTLQTAAVYAGESVVSVRINGQETLFTDAAPYYEDGILYIPLRPVAERIHAPIRWDSENRRAILQYRNLEIQIHPDDTEITVVSPKERRVTDAGGKPILKNGRLYVALETLRNFMDLNDGLLAQYHTVYLFDAFPRQIVVDGGVYYISDVPTALPAQKGNIAGYTKNGMEIFLFSGDHGYYVVDTTGEARRYEPGATVNRNP
jgi:hypothetical protein